MDTAHDRARPAYRNFRTAIYARAYEVVRMADRDWLDARFRVMERALHPDKIYIETHRDMLVVPERDLLCAIGYFQDRGLAVSGGIATTVDEGNRFQTFCYTNEEHRRKLREVVELTAARFDEFILDDFFFTNCKCESCIRAKGNRSWSEFRLELLKDASLRLILEPAKRVNPDVEVVVKFPNWYEQYAGCGLNLEAHSRSFDRVYTGTETRDPVKGAQHLQEYLGYAVFRYLENAKPGGNGGGWVDTGGMKYLDRYAEQVWLTLFARAPEITFFDFRLLQQPILPAHRAPWQDGPTSFSYDATVTEARREAAGERQMTVAFAAGAALATADAVVGSLGSPIGIPSYKPFHSTGEDFIHTYLGMIGIPIELTPVFPDSARTVLLAESAAADPKILERIEAHVGNGGRVVITTGLLRALQGKGLSRIAEIALTGQKAMINGFNIGWAESIDIDEPILVSHMRYNTNDSWEDISGRGPYTGYPILHEAAYGKGMLIVLNLPDNWSDLYRLPPAVLTRIRDTVSRDLPIFLEGDSRMSLFLYDNRTLIVESFRDEAARISLWAGRDVTFMTDLLAGETVPGSSVDEVKVWNRTTAPARSRFDVELPPHSFRVFRW